MEMPKFIFRTVIGVITVCFILSGCKKKEEEAPTTPTSNSSSIGTTQQTQRASDQSDAENASNQAMDDANTAMGEISTTRDIQSICGMTYDSSTTATTGIIILTYDGTNCSGKKREGTITIQLPVENGQVVRFSAPGTVAKLTFTNYKVTNVSTNKSVTLNGTHLVKNMNQVGPSFYTGTPIVHNVKANMQIEYEDGTECTWNAKEIRTLSFNSGLIKAYVEGDTTIGGHLNTAFWGVNRLGDNYSIDVETPFSYDLVNPNNTTCVFKPLTGKINFRWSSYLLTLTYGVNSDGTTATTCPFGYKFNWVDATNTPQQIVLPYY